ncbi:unnamed protein product, partial [Symbiodinium sp. KB8]
MGQPVHLELERIWWLGGIYLGTLVLLQCGIRAARAHEARREEDQCAFRQHLNCEHRESVDRTVREEEGFLGNTVIFPHCDLDEIFTHAPGGHMLKYNADRSLSFTVIFMFKHTLLSNTQILHHMRVCVLVAALTGFIHIGLRAFTDVEPMQRNWLEDADKMCSFLTSLIGVLLGFYISTVMTRWWSMRSDGIGGMWGAVNDLCVLTGSFFPGPEWRKLRTLILRYGLISFELTFMENEDQDEDLDALMQRHLLTSDEAACLAGNPSKGMAVWTWVGWIFRELQKQGHLSDITLRLFLDKAEFFHSVAEKPPLAGIRLQSFGGQLVLVCCFTISATSPGASWARLLDVAECTETFGLLPKGQLTEATWQAVLSRPKQAAMKLADTKAVNRLAPLLRLSLEPCLRWRRLAKMKAARDEGHERLRLLVLPGFSLLCWAAALDLPRFAQTWPSPASNFLVETLLDEADTAFLRIWRMHDYLELKPKWHQDGPVPLDRFLEELQLPSSGALPDNDPP